MRRQHEDPEAAAIAAALAGVTAGTGAPAVPAFTTSGNGVMETGEFVLWRDANFTGPLYDEFNHRSNYDGLTYVGTNVSIDNSASSAANYDATTGVQAFVLRNWGGAMIQFLRQGQVSGVNSWFYNQ